ncbi:hypothetical protein V1511DRAFT_455640 [Dipodascopsis uninucleata]
MRLHLSASIRRGLALAFALVLICTISIYQRQTTQRTAAVIINTPPSAIALDSRYATTVDPVIPSTKHKRTLHFILPATQMNKLVCKTLFSAGINGYPAPVLLNYNSAFRDAEEARFMKIAAIHKYLSMKVSDDDLVLIMDSYDTWFQLPFDTLIERYYKIQEVDRKKHFSKYIKKQKTSGKKKSSHSNGIIVSSSTAPGADDVDPANTKADEDVAYNRVSEDAEMTPEESAEEEDLKLEDIPPYAEQAVFGADKICWPNPRNSPACKDVPESTLPKDIYGPNTDHDPYEFEVRPRWLNSGNIIGPAKVLKEIYMRAFDVQQRSGVHFSDQLILADIFGKQDLPIRIDYDSLLFQTMTHAHFDVLFLYEAQVGDDEDGSPVIDPITGVSSLTGASLNSNVNDNLEFLQNSKVIDEAFYVNTTRRVSDKYYGWNRVTGNVPAVFHFNGPKIALETWWNKMWWVHDENPVHRLRRLKYVRRTSGVFIDEEGKTFKPWNEMCGKFDMFEYSLSPFDHHKVVPGEFPSLDPEPFILGMDPRKTPSDVLDDFARNNIIDPNKLPGGAKKPN